jgi:pimeloyl-ACP methyl ester carboxylesterase
MVSTAISAPVEDARTARYRQAERALWQHYGLAPSERFVEVGSPPIRIRVVEIGSGPPVLFAHGTAGSAPAFAALLSELRDHRCLLMDRPGFGLSSPMRYSADTFGRTIADLQRDVLDAMEIERADVVGHSIGDVFALRLALHHPGRIRRVVLLGAGPIVQEAGVPLPIRLIASPLGAIMVRLTKRQAVTRSMIRGSGHGPSLDDGRIPNVFIEWRTAVNRETDSMRHERAMVRTIVGGRGYRPELVFTDDELASIAQPTLMLYGTADSVGSPSVWTRVMGVMPNGRLSIMEGAGHMLWLDEPSRVASEMRSFLGR